jgi:hypothetical protein
MKTNQPTTVQASTIDEILNGSNHAVTIPTIKQLTKNWVVQTQDNFESEGGNDNSNELANVAFRLIDNYGEKPFNISDFILLAGYLDLGRDTVVEFFNGWTDFLAKTKRVQTLKAQDSAYEWDSYHFLT